MDNRDFVKECGFRISVIDISPGREFALRKHFTPSIVEVTYYDSQRRLHSLQSTPKDLHDRWNHFLFSSDRASPHRSTLSVEIDGVTVLASAVSRGATVVLAAPLTARSSCPCTSEAPLTATTASQG